MKRGAAISARVRRGGASAGVLWHAGWALAVAAGAAILALQGLLPPGPELAALAVSGGAAVLGGILSMLGGPGRIVAILVWAFAGATACHLTGGPAGPLAAWTLAAAAAATAFRARELLSLGAAASLAAAATSALDAALFHLPPAAPEVAPWLGLLALGVLVLGFTAGLLGYHGAVVRDTRKGEDFGRLVELLENQPLLLASVDRSGRVLSAAGATVAGYTARELEGQSLGHMVAEADLSKLAAAAREALQDGRASIFVAPPGDPDGWLEIFLRASAPDRLVVAVRDAGEQFARERRLDQARLTADRQNAGKSRFLANMSHELRTPLNAIMGFSDIMRQRLFGPLADRYGEYAQLIHESGAHLLELINDVLDMSKIEAERFELAIETFDAREAVNAVLRLMRGQAEQAGVTLRSVLAAETLEVEADRRAIKQIALNLISNALKFTPRGGSVAVTLQRVGDTIELIVADTGVGIAEDDLARLGRPFEQAGDADQRSAGSGLGLSLVRAFARLHGGEMLLESRVGEGTTVTVRLPVLAAEEAAAQSKL
jgi:cell cycle sensor histidine kinase DivJ